MNCTGIHRLFDAYWDDEITQAERETVERHLAACPRCRERYESLAHTLEAMASLPRVEAAPDLVDRVTARARQAARAADVLPASPLPAWVPAAAVAAVLVVAALAILPRLGGQSDRFAHLQVPAQPALVAAVQPSPGAPKSAGTTAPPRQPTATDSIFDHNADVDFVVDPVALRHGAAAMGRSVNTVRTERAVISF
jgi:anti-sigma factor RsiW